MKDKEGKIVAMPTISSGSEYLLYNKTFLDELGMKVPTTYDELKEETDTLRSKGYAPLALGAKESWHLDDIFVWMSNQFGEGDIYKVEEGNGKFTDQTFVKTMNAWKKMVDDKIFEDGAVGVATYPDARDNYFYARKTPFFPTGSWHVSATISDAETKGTAVEKDDLGMVQFPSLTDKEATPTTGVDYALAINKDSKRKKAAMKFVKFMTTGQGQKVWTGTLQGSPVDKNVTVDLPEDATQTAKDSVALITKGQAESKLNRKLSYPELDDEIAVQMQNVYTGTSSVEEALKAIQTVNEGLDRD
jgi:raffinose/stachyose/melibiose transport system substrate-binding protein